MTASEKTTGMKRKTNWNATLRKRRMRTGVKWMKGSRGGRVGMIRLFIGPHHLHPSATRWSGIQTILSVTHRTRAFITTADCSILLKDQERSCSLVNGPQIRQQHCKHWADIRYSSFYFSFSLFSQVLLFCLDYAAMVVQGGCWCYSSLCVQSL